MSQILPSQKDDFKNLAMQIQSNDNHASQVSKNATASSLVSHNNVTYGLVKTEPFQERCCRFEPIEVSSAETVFTKHKVSMENDPQENNMDTKGNYLSNRTPKPITSYPKPEKPIDLLDSSGSRREEKIDVTSNEEDISIELPEGWKKGEGKISAEMKSEQCKEQLKKMPRLESDYVRYIDQIGMIGELKERPDFSHYRINKGVIPDYHLNNFYPPQADSFRSHIVYMPPSGDTEREEALRRVYYEDIVHQHVQMKSAFQKPSDVQDRGGNQVNFLGPAMRLGLNHVVPYIPFYDLRSATSDIIGQKGINAKRSRFQDDHNRINVEKHKSKLREQRISGDSEDYRIYDSTNYTGMNSTVPFPYLQYRSPILSLDNIHRESKYTYPCCAGAEKVTRYSDVPKVNPYMISPIQVHAIHQLHQNQAEVTMEQTKNIAFKNPSEMHPSFKEFLEAERERLAADHELTQESQSRRRSNPETISNTLPTWQVDFKEDNVAMENGMMKSPNKHAENTADLKKDQPSQFDIKEKTAIHDQNTVENVSADKAETPSSGDTKTVKKITCNVCNKSFNRTSNLYTHMRTHSTHKPHVCEFCGKRFHQKADLRIHRYIHTGEKPHKCTKCGRGFKQLTHLKYHMRTHSDVRMYKCPYCEKGFNQKSNLQAHIFGHTGQRPHKCDVCGKGFTLASTLNTHKRTHLPNKPFQCQFCDRAFYQKNALKMHYVSTHPYSSGAV